MTEIQQYLDLPDSHRLWSLGLELFKRYGISRRPDLLAKFQHGPLGYNRRELEEYLQSIAHLSQAQATPEPAKPPQVIVHRSTGSDLLPQDDPLIRRQFVHLRHLRQEQARTAQSFHNCTSDADRAAVCDKLDLILEEIRATDGRVEHIRLYGTLPKPPEPEAFEVPEDLKELKRLRNRKASHILKVEKRIEHLLSLPEKHRKRAKLPEYQAKLRDLSSQKAQIIQKIEQLRNGDEEENE